MATELKLYNTLTRTKEVFKPIDAADVRVYVCGPTVYDFAHIGNARPVIVFDVLFRLLRHLYGEDHVTYVRNITDVDDKINARALRDFPDLPLNEAIRRVTEKTANQFHEDVKALGCLEPTHEPRATEHIEGMVAIIQQLLDRGHAYVAQGEEGREALFDVRAMPEYGQLSRRKLDDQQAGARVAVEAHKRNPEDFVLWKESAPNEPGWPAAYEISDTNRNELRLNTNTISIFGRPGWHIECSAMSKAFLGEEFDIHGGGLDLIFPHHENEIAQSRCAHGTDVMANFWMHNGFLQVEGRKMSKSEGNFVTIHELLNGWNKVAWPGGVVRLAMLMTNYRQPLDFTEERLREAINKLAEWFGIVWNAKQGYKRPVPSELVDRLSDDLNTVSAVAFLNELEKRHKAGDPNAAADLWKSLEFLGISIYTKPVSHLSVEAETHRTEGELVITGNPFINAINKFSQLPAIEMRLRIETAINERLAFLAAKNFAEADRIRDELLAQGIQLKDSKDSVTGERVTAWEVKR
jgi:cysteinyl-tRNA synthetase